MLYNVRVTFRQCFLFRVSIRCSPIKYSDLNAQMKNVMLKQSKLTMELTVVLADSAGLGA